MTVNKIRLTQYSKGSGCGCKIAPGVLQDMLRDVKTKPDQRLLVGNDANDDAAVYGLGGGHCLISTTDFFTPVVDDAFDFGKVAAANAISDVYAMGGSPAMAVAILGWPVDKLPASLAGEVLKGAREICAEAGIPLAGGHSIDSAEPLFGLAVTGLVEKEHIKRNNTPQEGDLLFLTKPLGSGIFSSALKRGLLDEAGYVRLLRNMSSLNKAGETFGRMTGVHAMTDVTGFGLLGHLVEMLKGSRLQADLDYAHIPRMEGVEEWIGKFVFPDNTTRIFNDVKEQVGGMEGLEFILLCDPQTSGGLLVSVDAGAEGEFLQAARKNGLDLTNFGRIVRGREKMINIVSR